jgi:hypothetical protein
MILATFPAGQGSCAPEAVPDRAMRAFWSRIGEDSRMPDPTDAQEEPPGGL